MNQTTIPGTEPEPVAESEQPSDARAAPCRLCHERWSIRDMDGYCGECRREMREHWSRCYARACGREDMTHEDARDFADAAVTDFLARFTSHHEPEVQP